MRPFVGFADQWLVDLLGIEAQIPHALMDETCCAVPQEEFSYIGLLYDYIKRHVNNHTLAASPLTSVPSDVTGMSLYLCAYYSRFGVVDSLTGENVKSTRAYQRCKVIVTALPDVSHVLADMVLSYKRTHPFTSTFDRFVILPPTEEDGIAIAAHPTTNVVGEEVPMATKKAQAQDQKPTRTEPGKAEEKAPAPDDPAKVRRERAEAISAMYASLRKEYESRYGMAPSCDFEEGAEYAVMMFGISNNNMTNSDYNAIINMTKHFKKHIIVVHSGYREAICFTKQFLNGHKDVIAIMTRPDYSGFTYYDDGGENIASVLGNSVTTNEIAFLKSQAVNAELDKIRSSGRGREEIDTKISDCINAARNKPLTGYDKIFRDWQTGVVYAVMKGNEIFSLVKSIWRISGAFFDMYRQLTNNSTVCAQEHEAIYSSMRQKTKDELIRVATASIQRAKERLKAKFDENMERFNQLKGELMELSKTMNLSFTMLNSMDTSSQLKSASEKASADYDLIAKMANVKSMFIINDSVHIYTRTIYAKDERTKRWHEIGDFHITINMHSDLYDINSTVKIRNLKNHIVAFSERIMEAPHVFNDGHICHGNLAVGMAEAYKNKDLYQIVMQLVLFLGYANTDDAAGAHVNKWPEVSEDVALGKVPDPSIPLPYPKEQAKEEVKFDEVLAGAIPIPVLTTA